MESVLYKFKILPDQLAKAKLIAKELKKRESETLETLREELTLVECIFFEKAYMYVFKLISDLEKSKLARSTPDHNLYEYLGPALAEVIEEGPVEILATESFFAHEGIEEFSRGIR